MARSHGALRAALALALLLAWCARPDAVPTVDPCGIPMESQARGARSTAFACGGSSVPRPLRGAAPLLFGEPIDLARADPRTLEVLPGIGPARAAAIVAERTRRPFTSVADLTRVRGIGPRTIERLQGAAWVVPGGASESQKNSQSLSIP